MEIMSKIRELVVKPLNAVYQCWMCGEAHNDAVAYLWHIRACDQEIGIYAHVKQRQTMPAIVVRQ
jgi:hypothetical protein